MSLLWSPGGHPAVLGPTRAAPLSSALTVQAAPPGEKPTICGLVRSPAPARGSPARVKPRGHLEETLRPDSSTEPAQGPEYQPDRTLKQNCAHMHTHAHTLSCAHTCTHESIILYTHTHTYTVFPLSAA